MEDTQDDGDLHLEAVEKDDLVLCELPGRVDPEWIGRTVPAGIRSRVDHVVLGRQDGLVRQRHVPRRPEDVDGLLGEIGSILDTQTHCIMFPLGCLVKEHNASSSKPEVFQL